MHKIMADIRDTLSRIRTRLSWHTFNLGAALTCVACALGAYFYVEIARYFLAHL